ncbi:MAG: hypothetical protein ATN35_05700 [Epulopiscium sp. Nele67-Bin004]|nr:MAG: hypothetical protein ATN35_05700 [Epulopiscium sp. Nele67-Bin004]
MDSELKHLILTGKNGSGKTSVLEKIRDYLTSIIDGNYYNLLVYWQENKSLFLDRIEKLQNLEVLDAQQQAELLKFNKGLEQTENSIQKYSNGLQVDLEDGKGHLQAFTNLVEEKYRKNEFILAYFSSKRNLSINKSDNIVKTEFKDTYTLEDNLDSKFIDYLVYLKTQQSFARDDNEQEEVKKTEQWFRRFEKALQDLFEQPKLKLIFNRKELDFYMQEPNKEPYTLNQLSDGYSAVLDIIINIILRMEKIATTIYNIEGIVLIDEIETHLHIQLQKKILPFLTSFFPKVQFIVTTHSPFILNSIKDVVIYDLENKTLVKDGLQDVSYTGVVKGYFGANEMSREIESQFNRYKDLVAKKTLEDKDFEEIADLGITLEEIPDFLSMTIATEFKRLQLEFENREDI